MDLITSDSDDDYETVGPAHATSHRSFAIYGRASKEKRWHRSRAMGRFLGFGFSASRASSESMRKWFCSSAVPFFLLLAMTPNVTSARMRLNGDWKLDTLSRRSRGASEASKLRFPNLNSLQLHFYRSTGGANGGKVPTASLDALLAATSNLKFLEFREFPRLDPGHLSLPHGLTSLVFIDTRVSDATFQRIGNTCFGLKRLCVYSYENGLGDPENSSVAAHRLTLLSKTIIASRLETLVLSSMVLSAAPVAAMKRFSALKVLGIRYAFRGGNSFEKSLKNHLLVNLVKDCPHLRGLLVAGAFRIKSEAMARFATAVGEKQFPNLRQVKLVCRSEYFEKLRNVVIAPIPRLFELVNVDLGLGVHDYGGTAQLVEAMEEACAGRLVRAREE